MEFAESGNVMVTKDHLLDLEQDASILCRLCANTDDQLIPIFKDEGLEHDLATKLQKYLHIIEITEFDELPSQICYSCASTVLAWHNLYESCLIADKHLRRILAIDRKDRDGTWVDSKDEVFSEAGIENVILPLITSTEECDSESVSITFQSVGNHDKIDTESTNISRFETEEPSENDCNRYSCAYCAKELKTRRGIVKHVKREHDSAAIEYDAKVSADRCKKFRLQYECDQCDYVTVRRHRLQEHCRKHTGELPYACNQCDKRFRAKSFLYNHERCTHEDVKEYPCDICGRCFSNKHRFRDHRHTHTGEKPYVCEQCGRTFSQKSALWQHTRTHRVPEGYKCQLCTRTFMHKSSLKVHMYQHNGVFRYKCTLCDRNFLTSSEQKRHLAMHSEERPFVCSLCGANFKLRKYLWQHSRTHKKTVER